MRSDVSSRLVQIADVLFVLFLATYGAVCLSALPYDFRDICYLFSLEQGRWVMQEWVHPIYVPTLDLLRSALALVGYDGRMLVPVEALNVVAAALAYAFLYRMARRFPGAALPAVVTIAATALSPGFWQAAVRPTPYALGLLTQTVALLLLVSPTPVGRQRYALSGAFAGVTMGFHASAMALAPAAVLCALLDPDPARTRATTSARILAFLATMLATVIACWAVFLLYRSIGPSFFENQDFASMFKGIEQVPGTSIYTSGSPVAQITSFAETINYQGGILLVPAIILGAVALLLRWRQGDRPSPFERRLANAALGNFAGIAGFFLINNTHNGFIFTSLTLIPVLLAVAVRDSRVLLALLALLTIPEAARNLTSIYRLGDEDPLLGEVRYLQRALGRRDVLLTPGTPFPEMLYLAHFNLFEVALDQPSHWSPEVPVLQPGPELRARVAWWVGHGGRVLYALGDASSDFEYDVSGAQKMVQIFWRPEARSSERGPALEKLRAALEASGLTLQDGLTSPNGQRYASIHLANAPPSDMQAPTPFLSIDELRRVVARDDGDVAAASRVQRARYLADLEEAIPGDPWRPCDVMGLVCQGLPHGHAEPIWCRRLPGCDELTGRGRKPMPGQKAEGNGSDRPMREACFWGPLTDQPAVEQYLKAWTAKNGLDALSDWGFRADRQAGELRLVVARGQLLVRWSLSDSCAPNAVTATTSGELNADTVTPAQLQDLVAKLPVATVRAAVPANARAEQR